MINFLILLALILIVVHGRFIKRRLGYLDPAPLLRDAGLALGGLFLLRTTAGFFLDYAWWQEVHQLHTFWTFLRIQWLPQATAVLLSSLVLILAFDRARRRGVHAASRTRLFGWAGYLLALVLALLVSFNTIDPWTIALFLGARNTGGYTDPIFHRSLAFYLFQLPFYRMLLAWLGGVSICAVLLYAGTLAMDASSGHLAGLRRRFEARAQGFPEPVVLPLGRGLPLGGLVRWGGALILLLLAAFEYFGRYSLLYSQHDIFVGADYVDTRLGLPTYWLQIGIALGLVVLLLTARARPGGAAAWSAGSPRALPSWLVPIAGSILVLAWLVPALIMGLFRQFVVTPNELTMEKPYIADHIKATRQAFGIDPAAREAQFNPRAVNMLDLNAVPGAAENIRLWDAERFKDTITQLQALRPYYDFPDVDVDRYTVNGQVRQVLLGARSLDPRLLPDTAKTWVNLNLQYTHGYGAVAGLINAATPEGEPELFLKNAPPESSVPGVQLTQPQIYFGEQSDQPVFVDTQQAEFDYPKGDGDAHSTYAGSAGIAVGSLGRRIAASIAQDDVNILLANQLTSSSRLLLHRDIRERVAHLAPFLTLDPDPYMVINDKGQLFWMLDAYTTSDLHPYAQSVTLGDQTFNYIRNSVKITVDAYNGTTHFYVFDDHDPILNAYRNVFPELFLPRSALPADLLRHIRYPELLFKAQADIYRLYHVQEPQVFYNKEDQWDVAKQVARQEQVVLTEPYYVMVQLPGEAHPEFVLMLPFTAQKRDNLIGWIAARCDPEHYGEMIVFRLPTQQLVYGPLQIESRVDQDRIISKDLSLWNQQGSRVLRGNTLVLPVAGTFLYVEPIYIQATQAKLPELKKVVLAVGNRLVYSDDLAQAIAELARPPEGTTAAPSAPAAPGTAPLATTTPAIPADVLHSVEQHLIRYRTLTAAGKLAEAGQELQAMEDELQRALKK